MTRVFVATGRNCWVMAMIFLNDHITKIFLGLLVALAPSVCTTASDAHGSEELERVEGNVQQQDHDGEERWVSWFERLEVDFQEQTLHWDAEVWRGDDTQKAFIATDGVVSGQDSEAAFGIRFSRTSARLWDFQGGFTVGLSWTGGDTLETSLTGSAGLLGTLPFDVQSEVVIVVSNSGDPLIQCEFQRDLTITSKTTLQALLAVESELNGSDLSSVFENNAVELGLRLRYELKRNLAPYIGLVWSVDGDVDSDEFIAEQTSKAADDSHSPMLKLGAKFFF